MTMSAAMPTARIPTTGEKSIGPTPNGRMRRQTRRYGAGRIDVGGVEDLAVLQPVNQAAAEQPGPLLV